MEEDPATAMAGVGRAEGPAGKTKTLPFDRCRTADGSVPRRLSSTELIRGTARTWRTDAARRGAGAGDAGGGDAVAAAAETGACCRDAVDDGDDPVLHAADAAVVGDIADR